MTVRILTGDVRAVLPTIPDRTFQCCVTSPPYFGLRDYGVAGQIGLEETPADFVATMVDVFGEVRRTLRDDGTLWLNLGDSYNSVGGAYASSGSRGATAIISSKTQKAVLKGRNRAGHAGLKPKDLMGIPWRVAFALQEDGWWLRSAIVWAKPNPMPESIVDRPTSSYEMVFLLAKSGDPTYWTHPTRGTSSVEPVPDYIWKDRDNDDEISTTEPPDWRTTPSSTDPERIRWRRRNLWAGHDYYYDADAVRENRLQDEDANTFRGGAYTGSNVDNATAGRRLVTGNKRIQMPAGWDRGEGAHGSVHRDGRAKVEYQTAEVKPGRNQRNVWTIATSPFPEAHFATFPPELAERCIRAGSRPGDHVLDPFGGAGTTGLVADRLTRSATLIELNPAYAAMAAKRLERDAGLFAEISAA